MLDKMKSMFEAQKKMKDLQKGLENITVDYDGAGGKIKIIMSGTQKVISMNIDESLLKPENKEILQRDMVISLNNTAAKVQKVAAEQLKSVMSGLNIPGL